MTDITRDEFETLQTSVNELTRAIGQLGQTNGDNGQILALSEEVKQLSEQVANRSMDSHKKLESLVNGVLVELQEQQAQMTIESNAQIIERLKEVQANFKSDIEKEVSRTLNMMGDDIRQIRNESSLAGETANALVSGAINEFYGG